MKKYAILSDDGLFVEAAGEAKFVPEGALELPAGFDLALVLRGHIVAGELVARPQLPPPIQSLNACDINECPPGTVITVRDVELSEVLIEFTTSLENPGAHLAMNDPGTYQFDIAPPLPFIGMVFTKEIPA